MRFESVGEGGEGSAISAAGLSPMGLVLKQEKDCNVEGLTSRWGIKNFVEFLSPMELVAVSSPEKDPTRGRYRNGIGWEYVLGKWALRTISTSSRWKC